PPGLHSYTLVLTQDDPIPKKRKLKKVKMPKIESVVQIRIEFNYLPGWPPQY
ncbi:12512_t:CDS:1, partial [Cetraspora pellucida]